MASKRCIPEAQGVQHAPRRGIFNTMLHDFVYTDPSVGCINLDVRLGILREALESIFWGLWYWRTLGKQVGCKRRLRLFGIANGHPSQRADPLILYACGQNWPSVCHGYKD